MARIGEPRNERSRSTRAALLDAAWRLIEERGAGAVTIEEVAQSAGVSRRSFYLHFASRTELIAALLDHMNEVLDLESSIRPIREAGEVRSAVEAWASHVARFHVRIRAVGQALDRVRQTDEGAAALWSEAMGRWQEESRRMAEWMAAEGVLAAPWTVGEAADVLWALMSLDLVADLVEERGWTPERYRDFLSLTIRRTLLTPPPEGG